MTLPHKLKHEISHENFYAILLLGVQVLHILCFFNGPPFLFLHDHYKKVLICFLPVVQVMHRNDSFDHQLRKISAPRLIFSITNNWKGDVKKRKLVTLLDNQQTPCWITLSPEFNLYHRLPITIWIHSHQNTHFVQPSANLVTRLTSR